MARLLSICFTPHTQDVSPEGKLTWTPSAGASATPQLPQLLWDTGEPWREANSWALDLLASKTVCLLTVQANMAALRAYAIWLEANVVRWWDLPRRKADRCIVKYRGALIQLRNSGALAASTASYRMQVVIRFYRWMQEQGLLTTPWAIWQERGFGVHLTDTFGIERTLIGKTTDLAIPNRRATSERLEGGLIPVTSDFRERFLLIAKSHASPEIGLILALGFFTGMRLGTICDLKIQTLENAIQDPDAPKLFRLSVGPRASPAVSTKHSVTGHIWIVGSLLEQALEYARSTRRLRREALAEDKRKDLLFLTRFGNNYAQRSASQSPSFNVEIHRLKKKAHSLGLAGALSFRFHQSRCTFATELADTLLKYNAKGNPVAVIKEALLHKDERTSLQYIRFAQNSERRSEIANAFSRAFMGIPPGRDEA